MLKKRVLCLALILCTALVLTACQQQPETFPNQPRQDTGTVQQAAPQQLIPTEAPVSQQLNFDDGSYDPASEEDGQSEAVYYNGATPAPVMQSEYAGATPVKIDPVDKPTPTPLPNITFAYAAYTAANLHLAFDGPAGWIPNDGAVDYYSLTNPDPSMDYEAKVELRTVAVSKDYSKKELENEVKARAEAVRSELNFKSFDSSKTAARFFIDGNGEYITYTGTLRNDDETQVAGRIIVNTVNKTLYILHVSYPRALATTFAEGVYNKVRHSMKLTN